jgi:hypothetical protein
MIWRAIFIGGTSNIPEVRFFAEGAPHRESRDFVAGFLDCALYLLLLGLRVNHRCSAPERVLDGLAC